MSEVHAADADIGGLALEMLAMKRRGPPFLAQQAVGGGGAIAREDAEGLSRLEPHGDVVQKIEELPVDRRHLVAMEIAHEPVDALERADDIAAVAPIDVIEAFIGVRIVKQE